MNTTSVALHAHASSVIQIERELAQLWTQSSMAGGQPLIRARTLNLVVCTHAPEERDRIAGMLSALAQSHPSRSIIFCVDRDGPAGIDAEIATDCHRISDHLLCYEQITLNVAGPASAHLTAIVEPLLVSHLPTYVWWMDDPPLSDDAFQDVLAIADRVILDSLQFAAPEPGLVALDTLIRRGIVVVNDLNWQRITPWREIVAQFFNGEAGLTHLAALDSVAICCGQGNRAQAFLLLGWLVSRLGWQIQAGGVRTVDTATRPGHPVTLTVDTGSGKRGAILRIELHSTVTGGEAHFEVERHDDQMVTTMGGTDMPELCRTTLLQWPEESELLQSEFSVRTHDGVFEAAIHAASRLGRCLAD